MFSPLIFSQKIGRKTKKRERGREGGRERERVKEKERKRGRERERESEREREKERERERFKTMKKYRKGSRVKEKFTNAMFQKYGKNLIKMKSVLLNFFGIRTIINRVLSKLKDLFYIYKLK